MSFADLLFKSDLLCAKKGRIRFKIADLNIYKLCRRISAAEQYLSVINAPIYIQYCSRNVTRPRHAKEDKR